MSLFVYLNLRNLLYFTRYDDRKKQIYGKIVAKR